MWGKSTMFEEAAAVPLIISGEGIPASKVVDTSVSHVDVYPFILDAMGNDEQKLREGFPGVSLFDVAQGAALDRNVLVEYHGMGSSTGAFMIRNGKYKYVYYVGYPAQLFDLHEDPDELTDLATNPKYEAVLEDCRTKLWQICDPLEVDARAKARQAQLLAQNGGREAVITRGDLGFTPVPGVAFTLD
jgi:choline-sulfatase